MAQLVAQIICTDKVAGSSPYVGSKDPNTGTYIAPTADGLKM